MAASENQQAWLNGQTEYEGMPLYLRRPQFINLEEIEQRFPKLIVAIHQLSAVTSNGSPESEYNKSLAAFDSELVRYFDASRSGTIVLVETFCGRRSYYFYAAKDANLENMRQHFHLHYPDNSIEWAEKSDPGATFIKQYTAQFGPPKTSGNK